jgi:hypothetical protein
LAGGGSYDYCGRQRTIRAAKVARRFEESPHEHPHRFRPCRSARPRARGLDAAPVADPNANAALPADTETESEQERIQAAGDSAADTAAAAADAMAETTTEAAQTEGQ